MSNQEVEVSGSGIKRTRAYIPREREEAEQRLLNDYFGDDETPPKYPKENFRRRYRMSSTLFAQIVNDITSYDVQPLPDTFWCYGLSHDTSVPGALSEFASRCIVAVDYVSGALEKDPSPHLTARQEQSVRLLENNKAPFRRYPECFLCLVGLSPYYPFDENTYPAFERPDGTDMGLLDFIKTADPRKVQAVEVQKKDDQVKLLESTSHCFMPLVTPAAGGSSSAAAPEVSAPAEVEPENVVPEDTYLDLTGPDEVVVTQSGKSKRKRLGKQSDTLPAKQLRKDHPSFATGTGGKTLAGLRQLMPTSPLVSRPSFQADIQAHVVQSARITDVPVYTAAATVTSARESVGITPTSDVAGSSQLETSEGSDDSFYELPALNSAEAKRCMDYEQLYTEFNVGAARQICLESEVRSRAEHELELKEKLKGKYDARGRLLEEKEKGLEDSHNLILYGGGGGRRWRRGRRVGGCPSSWSGVALNRGRFLPSPAFLDFKREGGSQQRERAGPIIKAFWVTALPLPLDFGCKRAWSRLTQEIRPVLNNKSMAPVVFCPWPILDHYPSSSNFPFLALSGDFELGQQLLYWLVLARLTKYTGTCLPSLSVIKTCMIASLAAAKRYTISPPFPLVRFALGVMDGAASFVLKDARPPAM
ncbi:hypothetical protein Tco_0817307, partial [Tanacetum coccineum]